MNSEALKKSEERQKKIIANAEARLRKITEAAKSEAKAPPQHKNSVDDGFVDFEVDSYVNEPTKISQNSPQAESSSSDGKLPEKSVAQSPSLETPYTSSGGNFPNGFVHRSDLEHFQELLGRSNLRDYSNHFHQGTFPASSLPFPSHTSHLMPPGPSTQTLFNGVPSNRMTGHNSNSPGFSQSSADLSNLLNALSSLTSGDAMAQAQQTSAQEETHPVLKPILNITVFFVLGIMTRIAFQLTTLNMNIFAPFLCLAVPLAIMTWGRRPQPMTGLLSAVLLFVRNRRTQTMIVSWVRLTTLFRGLSRLFACYFFAFVATHIIFELSSITSDINKHSFSQSSG